MVMLKKRFWIFLTLEKWCYLFFLLLFIQKNTRGMLNVSKFWNSFCYCHLLPFIRFFSFSYILWSPTNYPLKTPQIFQLDSTSIQTNSKTTRNQFRFWRGMIVCQQDFQCYLQSAPRIKLNETSNKFPSLSILNPVFGWHDKKRTLSQN